MIKDFQQNLLMLIFDTRKHEPRLRGQPSQLPFALVDRRLNCGPGVDVLRVTDGYFEHDRLLTLSYDPKDDGISTYALRLQIKELIRIPFDWSSIYEAPQSKAETRNLNTDLVAPGGLH
jgi:hypothetical protein